MQRTEADAKSVGSARIPTTTQHWRPSRIDAAAAVADGGDINGNARVESDGRSFLLPPRGDEPFKAAANQRNAPPWRLGGNEEMGE